MKIAIIGAIAYLLLIIYIGGWSGILLFLTSLLILIGIVSIHYRRKVEQLKQSFMNPMINLVGMH